MNFAQGCLHVHSDFASNVAYLFNVILDFCSKQPSASITKLKSRPEVSLTGAELHDCILPFYLT